MDGDKLPSIAPNDLRDALGTAAAPRIIDVRRELDFSTGDYMIASAVRRASENLASWAKELTSGQAVVVYCVQGHDVDAFLRSYGIENAALDRLAAIVCGADTSRHDLPPQCGGLYAISLGPSANFSNDHEMLEHGMAIYDALYTWCRSARAEKPEWPPAAASVKETRRG